MVPLPLCIRFLSLNEGVQEVAYHLPRLCPALPLPALRLRPDLPAFADGILPEVLEVALEGFLVNGVRGGGWRDLGGPSRLLGVVVVLLLFLVVFLCPLPERLTEAGQEGLLRLVRVGTRLPECGRQALQGAWGRVWTRGVRVVAPASLCPEAPEGAPLDATPHRRSPANCSGRPEGWPLGGACWWEDAAPPVSGVSCCPPGCAVWT